ncbi:glycosyltransferase family 4 protein [Candidatus Nitrosotenuis cloacae]|uniref:glycosyltransferase family 4 protein n=1 Tax=Candidatus Nitrosotenuis cloacae TaxID=1603555 RepID=UPI0022801193|nr:glycosyltransferase family 4 protein [Candidatus Nitrosotenuis cloacae]
MKVALVCPASLPATQFGGILFLCVDIAQEISKFGHDVTIYTTDLDFANNAKTFNKNLPRLETIHGFKINRTHVWFSFQLFYINPGMYAQIKKNRPDIIHTVGVRSFQSFIAALISKKLNIPLVISDQGGLTTHPDLQGNLIKTISYKIQDPMIKFVINQATKISVANEYEREIFSNFCDKSKTVVIRNGVSLDELYSDSIDFRKKYQIDGKFVLFVGRFSTVKGVDILLKAWALINKDMKKQHVKLVIMGVDFGFEKKMLNMIEELKIDDTVLVIKKPPRVDVISAYKTCEFLALPSRWELSPLTPLEGFAFRKPVISTTAHGIPHTITNGENSILVEPENKRELADAILKLLHDDRIRSEYGESGYSLVKNTCNSSNMAEKTLEIYKEILNR